MTVTNFRRGTALLGVGLVVIVNLVLGTPQATTAHTITFPTREAAIRAATLERGEIYAGACEAAISPQDIGKVCSRRLEERGTTTAYLLGRTFSEFNRWVFVLERPEGYSVVEELPLNFEAATIEIPWP